LASKDRSNLTPAATRARCIIDRLGLKPPIDVLSLIEEKAEVQWEEWPHDCDAITIYRAGRPLVLVNSDRPPLRQRFTLAHELGHVELAWHVETVECSPESSYLASAGAVATSWSQEREANEFASNLLVPSEWLLPSISGISFFDESKASDVLGHLAKARVSASAGIIALARLLLPGHAFFIGSSFSVSQGTAWPGERPILPSRRNEYLRGAYKAWTFEHQGVELVWAQMHTPVEISPQLASGTNVSAGILLREIVERNYPSNRVGSIIQSVNGVLGGLTRDVSRGWTAESIATVAKSRILEISKLSPLASDVDFPRFLTSKASEIIQKRDS
jgi:hypothetical protein